MATVYQHLDPGAGQMLSSTGFPALVKNEGTNVPVLGLAFDASTANYVFWAFRAVNYGTGNLSLDIEWYADTASSGAVVWGAQLAAITPNTDTTNVETKAFAAASTVTDTHLGTTGQRLHRATISMANLDSLAADDDVWLKVYRDAANGSDTMTGDAIVVGMTVSYSDT